MAVQELTAESTHDEIQGFVDDVAQARAGEEKPAADDKQKSDAEITAGHADNFEPEDTTAAPAKGDETVQAPEAKGEATAEESRDWFDDDLKAEISAYGIGETELADFTSREEVQRALRFFDKSALEAGRRAMAEGDQQPLARDDNGRFAKRETETKPGEPEPQAGDGYQVKLDKNVWDDQIVEEFTRLRDHYEKRLESLESRFLEADARADEQHFDSLVDSLGHADLFGKTDHENAKQLERRQDLHVAVKAQMLGLRALGRPAKLSDSLINRVARMVFADELGKKDLKTRTSKITKQSNGRQGGGATRPTGPSESARDEADRLYREMAGAT